MNWACERGMQGVEAELARIVNHHDHICAMVVWIIFAIFGKTSGADIDEVYAGATSKLQTAETTG